MNPQLIAKGYIGRDWAPIPIPYKSKVPVLDDWTNLRVTKENVAQFFNGEKQNVGVLLGEPSKNLIDIDLDCPEAVALAPIILPPTNAIFGRAGKPRSHFLYTVRNLICSKRFKNPANTNETLVEQRSTGGQTVFPGSVHPSGEPIEWAIEGNPAEVPADELEAAVRHLAVASLVRRYGQANINFANVEALLPALASAPEKVQEAARVWLRSEPQKQASHGTSRTQAQRPGSDNFWRAVNTVALANLDKWVPSFSRARFPNRHPRMARLVTPSWAQSTRRPLLAPGRYSGLWRRDCADGDRCRPQVWRGSRCPASGSMAVRANWRRRGKFGLQQRQGRTGRWQAATEKGC